MFLEYCVSGCTFVLEEKSHDCPEEVDLLLLEPDHILAEEHSPISRNRRSSYQNWNFQIPSPSKFSNNIMQWGEIASPGTFSDSTDNGFEEEVLKFQQFARVSSRKTLPGPCSSIPPVQTQEVSCSGATHSKRVTRQQRL